METNHDSPLTASPLTAPAITIPPTTAQAFIDITKPPFNAVGDGVTDDSKAVQDAVNACTNGVVRIPSDASAHVENDCIAADGTSARDELKDD